MNKKSGRFYFGYAMAFIIFSGVALAEDIDLFASGLTTGATSDALPNVIFVLDNTSNWSRQSQKWPGGLQQGQSEVTAIMNTLASLPSNVDLNVGIFEFTTRGSANQNGGYVRFDLQPYQAAKAAFNRTLNDIYEGINDPSEKRNSNSSLGNLVADFYHYLAGGASLFEGAGTPSALADSAGYTLPWSRFASPLNQGALCTKTYMIFIGNPDSNGPEADESNNSAVLAELYSDFNMSPPAALAGATAGGLAMPEYQTRSVVLGSTNQTDLGFTAQCYAGPSACTNGILSAPSEASTVAAACVDVAAGCFCSTSNSGANRSKNGCPGKGSSQQYRYRVFQNAGATEESRHAATGSAIDGVDYNFDDWTKFLKEFGVPVSVFNDEGGAEVHRAQITTYTIDVYNAKPSEIHSALLDSAAEQGGGYRQSATNAAELEAALNRVFGDIIDINTSFAAVTLPLSSANRARADNRVFVGMFRPGADREPRWLGNLKHYQLALFNGQIELADVNFERAINPQTGFSQSCATSFWTADTTDVDATQSGSQPYFDGLALDPNPVSACSPSRLAGRSVLSDSPDGPFVEKGGAAQQIRNQSAASGTSTRTILTESGGALRALGASDFNDPAYYRYLIGEDAGLRGGDAKLSIGNGLYDSNPLLGSPEHMPASGLRATIHGDIVHSRPLTVSYGAKSNGETLFRIFYGSNDGVFRSLNPDSGAESWAFIAPEHYQGVERQYRNTPSVNYFGLDASLSSAIDAEEKDYFFDGSTGVHTTYNALGQLTRGYIFPTMRRGGRMLYGLDISPEVGEAGTPPDVPKLLWKLGCPSLTEDLGCTPEFSNIGQTWSTPVLGYIEGYRGGSRPVLIMGGGWDSCLDVDSATYSCSGAVKGDSVFFVDGQSGALLAELATDAPVVAEVEPIDIDFDGYIDFIYVADAAGGLYRISLSQLLGAQAAATAPLDQASWFIKKIASVSSSSQRFMSRPVAGALGSDVFVTLGSGDRERPLKQNYPFAQRVTNRFYAFIDRPYPQSNETDLEARSTINLDGGSLLNAALGLPLGAAITDYDGWYIDLLDRGEQVVNQSAIGGGQVFFNTFQPSGNTAGLCANLGVSKAYRIPLFAPSNDVGEQFGEGIPIPPIIVTVKLDANGNSCSGAGCGPGEVTDDVVTVCIGCKGFDPIEIKPIGTGTLTEAFRVENIDRL
ncbi:MAG: PilC/PilY family type IV pilus protein [Luminiphilus sp.]|nr:PilC/PilY family type IV pilus protein [Luminiphilus sp.]